ncbi:LacI family DNA-binding transcriptional regulator [uncultured Victivallis sp.]|uniref:LacI family DNA-binding transcriptional regulator n=1 Tax=uncultured Victivallis sp. TaxID=354118 RepID=UPI0025E86769|nr:LacI family DNA-binding transcriptional regulator [uncultured Victivallis sp.]
MLMEHTTIKEVAARARVSTATVSRILNGKYAHRSSTVENVKRAIEELRTARTFSGGREVETPESVGVVMFAYRDFLNTNYNATLASSIMEELTSENYSAQIIALSPKSLGIGYIAGLVREHHLKGLLVPEFDLLYAVSEKLEKLGIPVVSIGNFSGIRCRVSSNSFRAGCDAANYLWSNGHRRFGIVSMSRTDFCQAQRIDGFCRTIQQLGGDPEEVWIREFRSLEGYSASSVISELVNMKRSPTAIFSTNSMFSRKLIAGLAQAGLHVPGDISLLSFEEDGELEDFPVPVSVMRQPTRDMGRLAVEMLVKKLRGLEVVENEELNCSLIIRRSVRSIPVE